MRIAFRISLVLVALIMSSCYFNRRLIYLQDKRYSEFNPTIVQNKKTVYRLQTNDILSVHVKSSAETEASNSSIFNIASQQGGNFTNPGSMFLDGYTIDNSGKINLPIIGEMVVNNLTLEEAQRLIQTNANRFLNKSTVIVKLVSFKVTVLGEVKNPGYIYVYNNQVTVLEMLGMAGDLTPVANRKNVKLIRQQPTGSLVILLDLTSPQLLKSEYFFLMPNDVLYVEPLKARSKKANLEILGVIFAGLTTAILILNYVNEN